MGSCCILETWGMAPLCLMWCIWTERNVRSFKDCESLVLRVKAVTFKSLYAWIAAYNSLCFSSFTKFLDLCSSFVPN
jgi:hypothetical protein